jgi:hypothetical protein
MIRQWGCWTSSLPCSVGRSRRTSSPRDADGRCPLSGEASYQTALQSLYRKHGGKGHDLKVTALVVPDGNVFDANAVRVEIGDRTAGYLSREKTVEYRAALGETAGQCSAKIVGGHVRDDGSTAYFGVKLHMAWPPRPK